MLSTPKSPKPPDGHWRCVCQPYVTRTFPFFVVFSLRVFLFMKNLQFFSIFFSFLILLFYFHARKILTRLNDRKTFYGNNMNTYARNKRRLRHNVNFYNDRFAKLLNTKKREFTIKSFFIRSIRSYFICFNCCVRNNFLFAIQSTETFLNMSFGIVR